MPLKLKKNIRAWKPTTQQIMPAIKLPYISSTSLLQTPKMHADDFTALLKTDSMKIGSRTELQYGLTMKHCSKKYGVFLSLNGSSLTVWGEIITNPWIIYVSKSLLISAACSLSHCIGLSVLAPFFLLVLLFETHVAPPHHWADYKITTYGCKCQWRPVIEINPSRRCKFGVPGIALWSTYMHLSIYLFISS